MHIFFSVGEPSGDQHAAHLFQELKRRHPDVRGTGYGGPLMREAGCDLQFQLTDCAVVGFLAVLPMIFTFIRLVREAGRLLEETRPDAVVLVDFPGFNWFIARKAKKAGIPVYYYMPPQLWAWASWRVSRMRKFVDHVLCGLPFEVDWYAKRGVRAEYVGHPFFDEVADYNLDREFCRQISERDHITLGILPGSRNSEIERNWPTMLEVMAETHRRYPDVKFAVASYRQKQRARCEEMLRASGLRLPIEFFVGKTPEIIESAHFCVMVSGSVSLEMLARKQAALVIYCVSKMFYSFVRPLSNIDSMTLPNLILGATLYPEWVLAFGVKRKKREIIAMVDFWLRDRIALEAKKREVARLADSLVETGATTRAADYMLKTLRPQVESAKHRQAA